MPTSFLSARQRGWSESRVGRFEDRHASLPFSAADYIAQVDTYFDARRFACIPLAARQLSSRQWVRGQEDAWKARWLHLPRVTKEDKTRGTCDMPFLRCPEERHYQRRLSTMMDTLLGSGEMVPRSLAIVQLDRPFDKAYWLRRSRWSSEVVAEVRIRQRADHFWALWHQVEFHDVPPHRRKEVYAPVPPWWDDYEVHIGLCVPAPPIYAYHSYVFFSGRKDWVALGCQVALCEWLVQVAVAFVDAAYYGIRFYARVGDARLYHDYVDLSARGRLFYLPPKVRLGIRKLGVHEIFKDCTTSPAVVEQLLTLVDEVDWSETPGFVWFNWDANRVVEMPPPDGTDVSKWEAWSARFGQWHEYWHRADSNPGAQTPVRENRVSPWGQAIQTAADTVDMPEPPSEVRGQPRDMGSAMAAKSTGSRKEAIEVIDLDAETVEIAGAVKEEPKEGSASRVAPSGEEEMKTLVDDLKRACAPACEALSLPVPADPGELVSTVVQLSTYVVDLRRGIRSAPNLVATQLRNLADFLVQEVETTINCPAGSTITPTTKGSEKGTEKSVLPAAKRQRLE